MKQRPLPESLTHSPRLASLGPLFFFAAGLLALAGAARAERSDWVQTPGGGIRLVTGAIGPDGTLPAMLEIRLEPGWRTYWTDPGASGIPPEVRVTGKGRAAAGLTFSGLRLPVPKRFDEDDVQYTGYDRPVAFPLLLRSADPHADLQIEASVFLGICKSICIPVQATLDLTLAATLSENPLDAARIRAAFAALPQAPSADFAVERARFDAGAQAVTLTLRLPPGSAGPDVFLAAPSGYAFRLPEVLPPTEAERKDGLTRVRIGVKLPPRTVGPPADGVLRATISAGGRAIETPLVFDP